MDDENNPSHDRIKEEPERPTWRRRYAKVLLVIGLTLFPLSFTATRFVPGPTGPYEPQSTEQVVAMFAFMGLGLLLVLLADFPKKSEVPSPVEAPRSEVAPISQPEPIAERTAPVKVASESKSVWFRPITIKNRLLLGVLGVVALIGGVVWLYFFGFGFFKSKVYGFTQFVIVSERHPMGLVDGFLGIVGGFFFSLTIIAVKNVIDFLVIVFPGIGMFMLGVNMLRGLTSREITTQGPTNPTEQEPVSILKSARASSGSELLESPSKSGQPTTLGNWHKSTCLKACAVALPIAISGMFIYYAERRIARRHAADCLNNLYALRAAVNAFAVGHDGKMPVATNWCDTLQEAMAAGGMWSVERNIFICPLDRTGKKCSYAFNSKLSGLDWKAINRQTVVFFESQSGWNVSGDSKSMITRHGHKFLVGERMHSVPYTEENLSKLRWSP